MYTQSITRESCVVVSHVLSCYFTKQISCFLWFSLFHGVRGNFAKHKEIFSHGRGWNHFATNISHKILNYMLLFAIRMVWHEDWEVVSQFDLVSHIYWEKTIAQENSTNCETCIGNSRLCTLFSWDSHETCSQQAWGYIDVISIYWYF